MTTKVAFEHLDEDGDLKEGHGLNIPQKKAKENRTTKMRFGGQTIWARIAFHPYFESTTMAVIVFNALWIGADTEWNHESLKVDGKLPLEPVSTAIENFFCVYFTVELTVRFLAFAEKKKCIFDMWFVFDGTLVACMIFETWVMVIVSAAIGGEGGGVGPLSALRLLRLLRLARMGRLMKFVPEMGNLVKGMVRAARSVVFILIFLVLVIYVFSIIFTASLGDRAKFPLTPQCSTFTETELEGIEPGDDCVPEGDFGPLGQDLFGSMGDSFMTLFTRGVLGDNLDETVVAIMDQSLVLMWLFFIFFAITSATLLNMLIGVVCDVIGDSAAEEEEAATLNGLKFTIQEAFSQIDANEDGLVTQSEWAHIKDCPDVRKAMSTIGIEEERMEERLTQMEEMIFIDQNPENAEAGTPGHERTGLTVGQLIEKVVAIRPDQNASALDLELLQAQVTKDQKLFKNKLRKFENGFAKVEKALGGQLITSGIRVATPTTSAPTNSANAPSLSNQRGPNTESRPDIKALANVSTQMLFQALKGQDHAPVQAAIHR